jgi:hypothetical protein
MGALTQLAGLDAAETAEQAAKDPLSVVFAWACDPLPVVITAIATRSLAIWSRAMQAHLRALAYRGAR